MTAQIIPFPKQPRAMFEDITILPEIHATHDNGMPVRRGDTVYVRSNQGITTGMVTDIGMTMRTTGERSYSVTTRDGVNHIAAARNVWPVSNKDPMPSAEDCNIPMGGDAA